jgi:hypothetical protein
MEKQIKKVKVRGLIFELEIPEDIGQDEILCDTRCPYGPGFCIKLPDPRKIKPNPKSNFMDFCGEKLGNAIPIKGSLDILKRRIEKNL